jgi:arsenite transporter
MLFGLTIGILFPPLRVALDSVQIENVSMPIALGLFIMMYPPLAKVKYGKLGVFKQDWKVFRLSLILNWVIGPVLMTGLAWLLLPTDEGYRNGLILVGLARCIAMVLIWNSLACGNTELAALLVALNSLFQIFTYSILGWLFLTEIPSWFGGTGAAVTITIWQIAKSVLIFLGIPFLLGAFTQFLLTRKFGEAWYDEKFIPRISPLALMGLLYTIVLIFAMQGDKLLASPFTVLKIALPLLIYFLIMFSIGLWLAYRAGMAYDYAASVAFTAAGNNFELAIAVAIGTFGISSREALAATVGPLVEVPALVGLVYISLWAKEKFFNTSQPLEKK